jgi:hypothetical protein
VLLYFFKKGWVWGLLLKSRQRREEKRREEKRREGEKR